MRTYYIADHSRMPNPITSLRILRMKIPRVQALSCLLWIWHHQGRVYASANFDSRMVG